MDILWWAGHVVGMVDGVDNLRPDEENETAGSAVENDVQNKIHTFPDQNASMQLNQKYPKINFQYHQLYKPGMICLCCFF